MSPLEEALKNYMQEHFDFSSMKKAGIFPKEMKFNDYEAQAKHLCKFFGYESIYEYSKHEIRCHISYAGERPLIINKDGQLKPEPFITVEFPNQLHI